jgi:hypothetical protein
MMPFTTHCGTAFQTFGQIEFSDCMEGDDHVLLCGKHHRHLAIGRHYPARMSQFISPIYVAGTFEPGF